MNRDVTSALLVAVATLAVADARADGVAPADRSLAETLFQEGKKLMASGAYAEACPKLAESHRLDPGGGTLLLLGMCHSKEGRTGSAWGELSEALALAITEGRTDRKAVAEKHLAALEPRISRLTVRVAPDLESVAGVEIARDGLALAKPAWGIPSPVDPGEHRVEARAPGRKSWSTTLSVSGAADNVVIDVPMLEEEVIAPPSSAPPTTLAIQQPPGVASPIAHAPPRIESPPPLDDPGAGRRTVGLAVGAMGIAALGFGAYFGVRAFVKGGEVDEACPNGSCRDASGPSLNEEARAAADASTVSFVLGAVGLGVGTALVLSAPRAAVRPRVAVSVSLRGAEVSGAW